MASLSNKTSPENGRWKDFLPNRPGIFQQNTFLYVLFCQKVLSNKMFYTKYTQKLSLGKAPFGFSVQDNTYGKHSQDMLRLEQEYELDL